MHRGEKPEQHRQQGSVLDAGQARFNMFAHVKPGDTPWVGEGLRDFFLYRDLGVAIATGGRVLAQLGEGQQPAGGRHRLASACR